jgi:pyruvate/2-oxoglutarate/acetoin dehydrogenase E1 component/pyruvate/2-oxoglutarate dehydrogenase complex dihydrolipoamide acyltransferase (E2) component
MADRSPVAERVAENLNHALHGLFAARTDAYLLGEDVLDPYGGAFKVTRGLSTAHPERVLTTPLSENAMVGVAGGLALRGNTVVVEFMFGDFALLALDQIVNFAAKSVSMYGRPVPLRLLLRCPVGGNRGYGATHSQSVQKFLVGVPDLSLWELSPFTDASRILGRVFESCRPAVLFEDKVLYTRRMFDAGPVDADWTREDAGGQSLWTVLRHRGQPRPDAVIITAGGTVHRCLDAAAQLRTNHGICVTVAVPAGLYPCDPEPVLPELAAAGLAVTVEESTPGGSWSGELAHLLIARLWHDLLGPVEIVTSQDSIIPAARHLEREVLVTAEDIVDRVVALCDRRAARRAAPRLANVPCGADGPEMAGDTVSGGIAVVQPHLNANDESALLIEWLVDEGAPVAAGQPIAVVETSKAAAELEAPAAGRIRQLADPGVDYPFGARLAIITDPLGSAAEPAAPTAPVPAANGAASRRRTVSSPLARKRQRSIQAAIAARVSKSHQTIPPAFAARVVEVDPTQTYLEEVAERTDALIGLDAFLVGALARLHSRHPGLFSSVSEDGTVAAWSGTDVAVTIDAGNGLFMPVIRQPDTMPLEALADRLVELKMAALEGSLADADLDIAGVGMAVSLNAEGGADVVQPIIMPGMACIVSAGAVRPFVTMDPGHAPRLAHQLTLGITHDHRAINGLPAMELLAALAASFAGPEAVFGG